MEKLTLIEATIILAIVAILMAAIFGQNKTYDTFSKQCESIGGKTVWDGRQYQCLKYPN